MMAEVVVLVVVVLAVTEVLPGTIVPVIVVVEGWTRSIFLNLDATELQAEPSVLILEAFARICRIRVKVPVQILHLADKQTDRIVVRVQTNQVIIVVVIPPIPLLEFIEPVAFFAIGSG
jgi:hypothetical protein